VVVHRCAYLLRVKRIPARGILVLCFNRNAVIQLRRRLIDLVGDDAKGVTIQTYHGLSLRLTGHAITTQNHTADNQNQHFADIIKEATGLLRVISNCLAWMRMKRGIGYWRVIALF